MYSTEGTSRLITQSSNRSNEEGQKTTPHRKQLHIGAANSF